MGAVSAGVVDGRPVRVFDLEQPRFEGMPIAGVHQPGYLYHLHRRHADAKVTGPAGRRSSASGMVVCMEHSGTHIDAPCHQAENGVLWGGIPAETVSTARGFTRLGIEETGPIVAPAILLDLPRMMGVDDLAADTPVSAADLQRCAETQGTPVEPGQVVLVRTGTARHWHDPERYLRAAGMLGDASQWLADKGVRAVGADNMAWDIESVFDEDLGCHLPGHIILLARNGIAIIENLNLEDLSANAVHRFTFICTPLKLTGATGSPVSPIAIA